LIIEQNLGIKITGTAVPGAPEKLPTSLEIIKYFDYMSGGFSGQGAGYPGAFGYLTSSDTDKVYLAPNMSFDFTVIQWLGLTPEQAAAYWAKEYASITSHASTPIIVFPWHDYGPTTWNIDPDNPLQPSYSLEMFTGVLDRAYKDGTEFVTLGDLAQRIESFEKSGLSVSMDSGKIVATVTSADAGHFALDLDQNIASVSNWYAYDKDSVFLPKNGGTFTISLGDAEDVTHISSLPMRADLLSVSGNGSDLSFSVTGAGDVGVDLRAPGSDAIIATGADKATISQETMTLSFSQSAKHTASIGYVSTALVIGTDANDTIFGGTKGETIVGLGGNDVLYGGGGADAFVFSAGFGNDTVMDFDPLGDLIHLVGTNFTSADNVLSSFSFTSAGAQLSLNDADTLLLNGIGSNQLTTSNFFLSNDHNWV
jgi:serralysin